MTMMVKDPGARIDFEFDWRAAYPDGQAVVASGWTVVPDEPGGVAVPAAAHDLEQATATLAGGIAGHVYRITNRVTMSDGQVDERSVTMRVEER
ncbi:phage fiber-tail adaptor protein [Sphingopyxis fribergensis]